MVMVMVMATALTASPRRQAGAGADDGLVYRRQQRHGDGGPLNGNCIESPHTQAQPKGLGQPCRASQASEANGQLHPHRQLELSLQTVGRPCALMMMQIPVMLLQGKGVGLAPSLGILIPKLAADFRLLFSWQPTA